MRAARKAALGRDVLLFFPPLHLRCEFAVNGKAFTGAVEAGPYVALRRKWAGGDVIELDMPMRVRLMVAHPKVKAMKAQVAEGDGLDVTLIPYFAWANRGASHMTVWMPLAW